MLAFPKDHSNLRCKRCDMPLMLGHKVGEVIGVATTSVMDDVRCTRCCDELGIKYGVRWNADEKMVSADSEES